MQTWEDGFEPGNCIIECLSDLSAALRGGFAKFLPLVLPKLAATLHQSNCSEATTAAALRLLQEMASLLRDWTHLLVPALLFAAEQSSKQCKLIAVHTLLAISCSAYIAPHLSRILPVIQRISTQPDLHEDALRCMCALVKECGNEAITFVQGFERHNGLSILDHPYYIDYIEGSGGDIEIKYVSAWRVDCNIVLTTF